MTKETMIRNYRKLSAADSYILGFVYNHDLYMIEVAEIMPRFMKKEKESQKNGGADNLRLRLSNQYKEQLIRKGAEKIGTESTLSAPKYNKGEIFEKLVTERMGLAWEKDNLPFYMGGDISINGKEIQVKLDKATICSSRSLVNARNALRVA